MKEWCWCMEMKVNLKFLKCYSYSINDYRNVFSGSFAVPSGMASSIWSYTPVPKSWWSQPTRDKAICKLIITIFLVLLLLNICYYVISWFRDSIFLNKYRLFVDIFLHISIYFCYHPPKKCSISSSVLIITSFAESILLIFYSCSCK